MGHFKYRPLHAKATESYLQSAVPYYPGGSLYARNPPFSKELHQQLDFGREDH